MFPAGHWLNEYTKSLSMSKLQHALKTAEETLTNQTHQGQGTAEFWRNVSGLVRVFLAPIW